MDTVSIHDLEVSTHIGVPDEERSSEQTLKVSIDMETDLKKAGQSDAIEDTIDYEQVANSIVELAKEERKTIEKFAEDIAQEVLKKFGGTSIKVTIKKFVLPQTEAVSVTIIRP